MEKKCVKTHQCALPYIYVYQTTLVQHYILVDKQPAKRFVEDADCRKIYGAVAAQHCRLPLSSCHCLAQQAALS